MARTAIALRHVFFEDLGILEPLLAGRGYRVRYFDVGIDDLRDEAIDSADLMVVLGGPISVSDHVTYPFLDEEATVIRERIDSGKPLLGICLGAQLIAQAMGARVSPLGFLEVGFGPLALTVQGRKSALASMGSVPVLHWHGEQFEIPLGAVYLAASQMASNQAFARGRNLLALQCHLEVDYTQIERWLIGHAIELNQHGIDPRSIRRDAAQHGRDMQTHARKMFAAWLDQLDFSFWV